MLRKKKKKEQKEVLFILNIATTNIAVYSNAVIGNCPISLNWTLKFISSRQLMDLCLSIHASDISCQTEQLKCSSTKWQKVPGFQLWRTSWVERRLACSTRGQHCAFTEAKRGRTLLSSWILMTTSCRQTQNCGRTARNKNDSLPYTILTRSLKECKRQQP